MPFSAPRVPALLLALAAAVVPSGRCPCSRRRRAKRSLLPERAGDGACACFIALRAPQGEHPAVIVIHEWWGLNDWVKEQAADLATHGYVALAIDLYRGQVADDADTAHQLSRGAAPGPRHPRSEGGGHLPARE